MGTYGINAEELMPKLDEFLKGLEGETSAEEIAKAFNMLAEKYEFPDRLLFVWTIKDMVEFNCIDEQIEDIGGLPESWPMDDTCDITGSCCNKNNNKPLYLDPMSGGKKHTKYCIQREILWLYQNIDDLNRKHPSGLTYEKRIEELYNVIDDGIGDVFNQMIITIKLLKNHESVYKITAKGDKFVIEPTKENMDKLREIFKSDMLTEASMWDNLGKKVI